MDITSEVLATLRSPSVEEAGSYEAYANVATAQVLLVFKYIDKMMSWINDFVPMKTGHLRTMMIAEVMKSALEGLRAGAPGVDYASFVNEMTGVHWTTPGSKYQFYEKLVTYAEEHLPRWYREELSAQGITRGIMNLLRTTLEV